MICVCDGRAQGLESVSYSVEASQLCDRWRAVSERFPLPYLTGRDRRI